MVAAGNIPRDIEVPYRFSSSSALSIFAKGTSTTTGAQIRRIGGLITTMRKDRAGETALPDGLDFSIFKEEGTFIDEHDGSGGAVVGLPDASTLKRVRPGEVLPDGTTSPRDGWWVEGEIFDDTPQANRLWDVAMALKKRGRTLGFSVDGKVLLRKDGKKTIARALVTDVAITRHPMNPDARAIVLAKSLQLASLHEVRHDVLAKALSASLGMVGDSAAMPEGPVSGGAGGGRVLSAEDFGTARPGKKKNKRKRWTRGDLVKGLLDRLPGASAATVGKFADLLWEIA